MQPLSNTQFARKPPRLGVRRLVFCVCLLRDLERYPRLVFRMQQHVSQVSIRLAQELFEQSLYLGVVVGLADGRSDRSEPIPQTGAGGR
jgi:hypothetical protein